MTHHHDGVHVASMLLSAKTNWHSDTKPFSSMTIW